MTLTNYTAKNNATAYMDGSISAGATSMLVQAGYGALFPSTYPFLLTLENYDTLSRVTKREIVKCTNRSTDTFTILRSAGYCPDDYAATTQTNTAFSFAPDASNTVVVSLRMTAEQLEDMNAELARLETAKLNITDYQNGTKVYAATSTGNDTYVITLSPAIGAYAVGQNFRFLADVGNTGAASINVNGLGAKTIKKLHDQDLSTGDIEAGQIVTLAYDGTYFQMDSQVATIPTIDITGTTESTFLNDNDETLVYDSVLLANRKVKAKYIGMRSQKYTAATGNDIPAQSFVFPSASNTIKVAAPTAKNAGTSVTTAQGHKHSNRSLYISNGIYLHLSGGNMNTSQDLYGQVRTLNAAETDFSNGTEANIFLTSNGTRWYDCCQIDTATWMIIYQKDNAGAPGGIACVCITISGTTITVGSEQSIETTGGLGSQCTVSKLDTLKALICYRKDSDTRCYCQVLTVSGTTITTNTAVQVTTLSSQLRMTSCQLTTNTVLLCVGSNVGNTDAHIITVSGTTPTIGGSNSTGVGADNTTCVKFITSTKAILSYYGGIVILTISGTTVTAGTPLVGPVLWATAGCYQGVCMVGQTFCIVSGFYGATELAVAILSISGTTITEIGSYTSITTGSTTLYNSNICKVKPYVYQIIGSDQSNDDYIFQLTPPSNYIGIAESAISGAAIGIVTLRFQLAILSGLTVGKMYIDDDGQPTANSSLSAPVAGVAPATTSLLLS